LYGRATKGMRNRLRLVSEVEAGEERKVHESDEAIQASMYLWAFVSINVNISDRV